MAIINRKLPDDLRAKDQHRSDPPSVCRRRGCPAECYRNPQGSGAPSRQRFQPRVGELRDRSKEATTLIDLKTRKAKLWHPLQMAGYCSAAQKEYGRTAVYYRWELCIPGRGISRRAGPPFFQGRPGLYQFRARGRSCDLRKFRTKTDIEAREKDKPPSFCPWVPIGSFPEVSVWITAGSSTPASRLD